MNFKNQIFLVSVRTIWCDALILKNKVAKMSGNLCAAFSSAQAVGSYSGHWCWLTEWFIDVFIAHYNQISRKGIHRTVNHQFNNVIYIVPDFWTIALVVDTLSQEHLNDTNPKLLPHLIYHRTSTNTQYKDSFFLDLPLHLIY